MAARIQNRRKLRAQVEQAEQAEAALPDTAEAATPATKPKKASAARKTPRAKKVKVAPRWRVRLAIFDGSLKQVAIFDYNQRAESEAALADLLGRKKGDYFLQVLKEPMPETGTVQPAHA